MSNIFPIKISQSEINRLNEIEKIRIDKSIDLNHKNDIEFLINNILYKMKIKIEMLNTELNEVYEVNKQLSIESKACLNDFNKQKKHIGNLKKLMEAGYKKNELQNKLLDEYRISIENLKKEKNLKNVTDEIINKEFKNKPSCEICNCKCMECELEIISIIFHKYYEGLKSNNYLENEIVPLIINDIYNNTIFKKIITKKNYEILECYKIRIKELKKKLLKFK